MISDLQVVTAAHCVAGKTTDDIAVLLADKNAQEKSIRMPTFSESRETHEGTNATVTVGMGSEITQNFCQELMGLG